MQEGRGALGFEFNVAAIHARAAAELASTLRLAEQRAHTAEQARSAAEQAHQSARAEIERLQDELRAAEASKRALWAERQALANENDLLMERIGELVRQLSAATSRDLQLQLALEISTLQRRLDERNRSLYGTSSERRPQAEADGAKEGKRPRPRKQTGAKRTVQPQLPIREVHHRLTPEQAAKGCRECRGDLVEMAVATEDSEEVDIQRVRYELRQHRCHKYRCSCCGWITAAPGPDKLVDGGRYSIAFAAQVAVDKYQDALPLARQVQRMKRAGLQVTSQALWDQLHCLYLLLLPTLLAVHEGILRAALVFADESPWRMMDQDGGSKRWWLWSVSDGVSVYYQLVSSRGTAAARALLHDFSGILMSDDYAVYSSLERERSRKGGVQQVLDEDGKLIELWTPDYLLSTCWMHARRYLIRAERYHPEVSPALDLVGGLYRVEAEAKDEVAARRAAAGVEVTAEQADAWLLEARKRRRTAESRSLVERIDAWRRSSVRLAGSALAEALDHLDRLWSRLVLFLDDPRIPLDNGHAERQMRGPIVGRNVHARPVPIPALCPVTT